jgi:5-methylcytosine-specific restriction protein A
MAITRAQAQAAYAAAKRVRAGELRKTAAVAELNRLHRLNSNSGSQLVNAFQRMMTGRRYERTMNPVTTDYFLEQIRRDFGNHYLRLAIKAVREHLQYYERLRGNGQPQIRKIVERYASAIKKQRVKQEVEAKSVSAQSLIDNFEQEVMTAKADSSEKRRKRLETSIKKPQKITATTALFIRNPDVVAEVLLRAKGICEQCGKQAPFIRAKDGEPYLEVHHRRQLANGGEDTIDNACAVCPNCHRELHYGKLE